MATLEITTMSGCPLLCTYCPQDKFKANYHGEKYLSLEDLKKVIDKMPAHVHVEYSVMADPWANPACTDMLEYTLKKGFRVAVYTTLYGMKDPERVASLLLEHGPQVEVVCLHLPDAEENMTGWRPKEYWFTAFEIIMKAGLP